MQTIIPDIRYAAYLGSKLEDTGIKWLQSPWIVMNKKILGYTGPKFVESFQMLHHLFTGKYAYKFGKDRNYLNFIQIFLLSMFLSDFRVIVRNFLKEILRNPINLFRRATLQLLCYIIPPGFVNGIRDDPYYVPDLYISQKTMFDRKKYPFFTHSKVDFFLAYKAKQVAGRIALIRNNNHILYTGEKCGFFGFFESINDFDVAEALLDKSVNWIRNEGLESTIGPENFTTNDLCGFLTEGFNNPPVFMMSYNKPYYNEFFELYGFKKKLDLASYLLHSDQTPPKISSFIQKVEEKTKRNSIIIRPINFKEYDDEIRKFREVYNYAYKKNWGFVPLNEDEFRFQANELKKIADPGSVLIAEKGNKIIAFLCAIPDINQILIKVKNGRLFPFGFIKLLIYQKKINNLRILILGVINEYRNSGIDALLYSNLFEYARKANFQTAEAGYVMENNVRMISILKKLGGQIIKKYRLFEYRVI